MKIIIPVNEKNQDTKISKTLGRALYFYVKDLGSGEESFVKNHAATSSGGAGIQASQIIIDLDVDVLITPKIGKNAKEVLEGSDIKVFQTESDDIKENIKSYEEGRLEQLV